MLTITTQFIVHNVTNDSDRNSIITPEHERYQPDI